ncbi:MAG TPA: N-acetylmuramoyl-L-alanine amidase [Vicinamibacteria bacterium]|nr:N-acetylmuramoyl-L-alanine amidase [Vicinamibacteria bacterium]
MKPSASSFLEHRSIQRSLDRFSSRIPDPGEKLWFISRTIEAFESTPPALRKTPLARSLVFHFVAVETMGELVFGPRRGNVRLPVPALWGIYRLRHAAFVLAGVALASGVVAAGAYGFGLARAGTDWVFEQIAPPPDAGGPESPAFASDRIGKPPEDVWLVRREGDEELWSNGLRVVTSFETRGEPRQFFAFPRNGSPPKPLGPAPVGIVYHASESDMAPFGAAFNRDILTTTRDLVGWLSRRRIYHYVIDRFGQVYRVVSDETVAVHAGVSIWGDAESYYLNLNESFIGVAFESQWSASGGDAITTAQIQSALSLTDLLRARYAIADINCVPHGLVSVSAGKKLIGYHADWAHNFPFGALGLPDNYQVPPPSITAFGFGYDEDLVARLGGSLWPGVAAAEREVVERAGSERVDLDTLRGRLQQRYLENVELLKLANGTPGFSRGREEGKNAEAQRRRGR